MSVVIGFLEEALTSILGWLSILQCLPGQFGEPFRFAFMQRALLTSVLVGGICGLLSSFVVLKRWALLGDAVSHAVLPGVALAYLANIPFSVGAFASGTCASVGMGLIERNTRIKQDAAMGIMFTAYFALGIVIISRLATSTHLMHILFGNVLGVRMATLMLTFVVSIFAFLTICLFFKELQLYTFDPEQATAIGINTGIMHYGLMLLVTMTIVASLETVGIILVVAMLITPGATAHLLTNRLSYMLVVSTAIGVVSSVIGLYLSFIYDIASGGTIVLVVSSFFLITLFLAPQHGIFRNRMRVRM